MVIVSRPSVSGSTHRLTLRAWISSHPVSSSLEFLAKDRCTPIHRPPDLDDFLSLFLHSKSGMLIFPFVSWRQNIKQSVKDFMKSWSSVLGPLSFSDQSCMFKERIFILGICVGLTWVFLVLGVCDSNVLSFIIISAVTARISTI